MIYLVHTDKDNYVEGLELTTKEEGIVVPDEVLNSNDLICYKYENGTFTFDNAKKEMLIEQEKQREEEERLKPTTEDLAQALDILTDIVLGGE